MRRTDTVRSLRLLSLLVACGQGEWSVKQAFDSTLAATHSAGAVTRIDSAPSALYRGAMLYVAFVSPKTPHVNETIVASKFKQGPLLILGNWSILPTDWPVWTQGPDAVDFTKGCEELITLFYVGEPQTVLRVDSVEAIPGYSQDQQHILTQFRYDRVDSGPPDLSARHVEYTAYSDGDLYRVSCDLQAGHRPAVSALLLAENVGAMTVRIRGRPPLRDLAPPSR